jgi:hypothetical protein
MNRAIIVIILLLGTIILRLSRLIAVGRWTFLFLPFLFHSHCNQGYNTH